MTVFNQTSYSHKIANKICQWLYMNKLEICNNNNNNNNNKLSLGWQPCEETDWEDGEVWTSALGTV